MIEFVIKVRGSKAEETIDELGALGAGLSTIGGPGKMVQDIMKMVAQFLPAILKKPPTPPCGASQDEENPENPFNLSGILNSVFQTALKAKELKDEEVEGEEDVHSETEEQTE